MTGSCASEAVVTTFLVFAGFLGGFREVDEAAKFGVLEPSTAGVPTAAFFSGDSAAFEAASSPSSVL